MSEACKPANDERILNTSSPMGSMTPAATMARAIAAFGWAGILGFRRRALD